MKGVKELITICVLFLIILFQTVNAQQPSGAKPFLRIHAVYPGEVGNEAEVTSRLVVSEQGHVMSVDIISSRGLAVGALEAIGYALKKWKFKPYVINRVGYKAEVTLVARATKDDEMIVLEVENIDSRPVESSD